MNDRQLLHQTDSGPIELVWNEEAQAVRLQFNCRCEDALPYCRAVCCRGRDRYNVSITPEEAPKYDTELLLNDFGDVLDIVLQTDGNNCCYLKGDSCSIHSIKPSMCKRWHCSPGGKGDGLDTWSTGWALHPTLEST